MKDDNITYDEGEAMKAHERTWGWLAMWVVLFTLVMACCVAILGMIGKAYGEERSNKFNLEKFRFTVTITYNSLTLEEAAAKEREIKTRHNDACSIQMKVTPVSEWPQWSGEDISISDDFVTDLDVGAITQ